MLISKEDIKRVLQIVEKREIPDTDHTPSAVLMPFFNRNDATHLIYIRRTVRMRLHSGNMAFPGGKIDPGEKSYETAIRETEEEIGVTPESYTHLGDMGYFQTLTSRFDAAAHLAWCHDPPVYHINRAEVDEVIEIPLSILIEQFRPNVDYSNYEDIRYLSFHFQPENSYKPANLWGLTARITHHFISGLLTYSRKH